MIIIIDIIFNFMNTFSNSKSIKELYKIGKTIGRGTYAKVKQAKNRETGQ